MSLYFAFVSARWSTTVESAHSIQDQDVNKPCQMTKAQSGNNLITTQMEYLGSFAKILGCRALRELVTLYVSVAILSIS